MIFLLSMQFHILYDRRALSPRKKYEQQILMEILKDRKQTIIQQSQKKQDQPMKRACIYHEMKFLMLGVFIQQRIYYIHKQFFGMLDLYLILVPLFSVITLINLIYLKWSIRDNQAVAEITSKKLSEQKASQQSIQPTPAKQAMKYLLANFTLLDLCITRRSRNKLSLLLSISLIALASYYLNQPFGLCFVGSVTYLVYFFIGYWMRPGKDDAGKLADTQHESLSVRQKYIQLFYTIVGITINFFLIGHFYKNYGNILLKQFITIAGINFAIDNFAIRPIVSIILGSICSRSENLMEYIRYDQKNGLIAENYEEIIKKQQLQRPIGKMYSPSKLAKCVPVNIQIEPVPMNELLFKEQSGRLEKQSSLGASARISDQESKQKKQEMIERSSFLLKKIKKQRSAPPPHGTPRKQHNRYEECSLNSLFNSTNKQNSPHAKHAQQHENHSQKVLQMNEDEPANFKSRKFGSENVIMINPSREQPVQNEEDYEPQRRITEESIEQQHFNFTKKNTLDLRQEMNPLKISINPSSGPSSRNQPLRICLNGQENLSSHRDDHEEGVESDRFRRRRETIDSDEISIRQATGVLEIKLNNHPLEQIEEIYMNSPERRRRLGLKEEQSSRLEAIKKKKKKLSIDDRHRVIKFTTGEPYLEYLPNMLNKDGKKKKSQALSKKDLIIDTRLVNSTKQQKKRQINFENDENIVPSFRIEEV